MAKAQVHWQPHHDPYQKAVAGFATSYMSNVKWLKTFEAIADANIGLVRATWKFIESERLFEFGVPAKHDLMPTRFRDGRYQPFEYKWIEWIRFPRVYRRLTNVGLETSQNIDGLVAVLDSIGQLKIDVDEAALTIYGYGR